jgi:serine/threonine-protein kinase
MSGQVLNGRYLLHDTLGAGGMGAVYRATDLRTGATVAVKIPHPWLTMDGDYAERLHREARIAAVLTSPRIVRVIDFDRHEGRPFLVMEYVPGQTLAEALDEHGALPWRQAARIALNVARALDGAHRAGVVHRDLKPQNIKLDDDDDVKVLDFGIARAAHMASMTATNVVLGTPKYLAPERLGGRHGNDPADTSLSHSDPRSDLYALGVVLYEMVAGRPPFDGDTPWPVIHGHIAEPPPELPATTPQALARVIARALEKRPEDRYQTAAEMITALRLLGITEPIEDAPGPDAPMHAPAVGSRPPCGPGRRRWCSASAPSPVSCSLVGAAPATVG